MAIEGCGVSAFVVWKDETCAEIDEQETRRHFRRVIDEIKGWGYFMAGGVEAEIDATTRAEKRKIISLAVEEARGEIQVFCDLTVTALPLVKDGRAKVIAIMSERRSEQAPEIPTFAEPGFPKVKAGVVFGVLAPAAR